MVANMFLRASGGQCDKPLASVATCCKAKPLRAKLLPRITGQITASKATTGESKKLGGFLALCAAATFALNNTLMRRGVLSGSVIQAMAITVPFGVPLMFFVALSLGALPALDDFTLSNYAAFSAAGIAHFVVGRYFNYRAVQAIGTNLSGPLVESSILVALVFAVMLLDEKLTIIKIIGIILVMAGPLMITETGNKNAKAHAKEELAFTPKYLEGYIYSLLAAVAYGFSPIFVRISLENKNWHASIAGGLVSYIAATIVMVLIIVLFGQIKNVSQISWTTARWFCGAGFFVGVSQLLRFIALAFAPVSVVSPIHRSSLIFRLIFSYMINRKYESFASGMIAGTITSIAGAVLLSMSVDIVRESLNLPAGMDPIFNWSWP